MMDLFMFGLLSLLKGAVVLAGAIVGMVAVALVVSVALGICEWVVDRVQR